MDKWELRKLTELAEYLNGYAFAPDDWGTEGLPIIRIEQLKNPNAPTDFYVGKLPEKNVIEDGDLIFSWSASLFLRIWRNERAALNQHLFKVAEKPGVNREFLKSFIEFYLPELTKASHGSTMQHITRKELEKFSAQFPVDEAEQEKIADVIAALDHAIEQTEALIAKQQRIKTGLMQDLLTKGIDEHGNIRSEATHEFKGSALGRIPEEWDVLPLTELVDEPITYGIVQAGPHVEDGVPYIRTGDMSGDFIELDYLLRTDPAIAKAFKRSEVHTGDIVFALRATVGKVLPVSEVVSGANLTQGTAKISPSHDVDSSFLLWGLRTENVLRTIQLVQKGTTFAEITLGELRQISVAIPRALWEQQKIAEIIGSCFDMMKSYSNQLEKLQSLKQGLMHDLLTGKVRVTELLNNSALTPESV